MADRLVDPAAAAALMDLLEGITDEQMRAIGIEALRRWRRRTLAATELVRDRIEAYPNTVFALHDVGIELVPLLAERKGVKDPMVRDLKEVFIDDAAMFRAWMSPFVEFIWWLVRAGLAVEHTYGYKGPQAQYPLQRVFPTSMRLTSRGLRLLERGDDDPLLPGFLERIKLRCVGLSAGVVEMLKDARACLDLSLVRPAVLVMGAAYEQAIEDAIEKLITKGLLPKGALGLVAAKRLEKIRELMATAQAKHVAQNADDRRRIEAAVDFADTLRLARNDVAHGLSSFDYTQPEAEDLIVRAGFHLPGLWLLARDTTT